MLPRTLSPIPRTRSQGLKFRVDGEGSNARDLLRLIEEKREQRSGNFTSFIITNVIVNHVK